MDLFKTLKNAWRVPELRRRIIYTLWMFLFIRIGISITVPGVDRGLVMNAISSGDSTGFINQFYGMITGGAHQQLALFALGVGPYITASIIMQLLQIAITRLEELSKEGEDGRKKINKYTRYVTLVLALLNAWATTFNASRNGLLVDSSILTFLLVMFSFVAGSMLVMWIGEQITEKGIGNGISLYIFIGIIYSLPTNFISIFQLNSDKIYIPILVLIVFIALIAFAVLMSQGERRVAVQYAKRTAGRKVYGGGQQYIPIKVNLAGVMPIIFAMSIMSTPQIIIGFTGAQLSSTWTKVLSYLDWTSGVGSVIYIVLIFAFAFFYSTIAFNPMEIASNMKKSGGFIPGIRPGKPTSDYLVGLGTRITLLGAIFLTILALMPLVFYYVFKVNVAFTGTSLLIVVGVVIETLKQLESQMLMRHYKGFL
ncbi:MAG: preprotein translocase subunit SecY [Cellulosilyticum sp.]|nr:preprotein translocase subunit SecY [Cellulosilyticum sp.]